MSKGLDISCVGVDIPWVGGRYTMGNGVDIPLVGVLIYRG